jgi:endogenous inhibitor of DNA gyrase (YacG/DUF329 family)
MPWPNAGDDEQDNASPFHNADDEEPTVPCPYCRREIHEDSPRCPYCAQYVSREDAPPSRKPWWLIAGVVICLLLVYLWISGR